MSDEEKKPENPLAFPALHANVHCKDSYGMKLRDYFAAATIGTMIYPETALRDDEKDRWPDIYKKLADHAYGLADAMLEARAK